MRVLHIPQAPSTFSVEALVAAAVSVGCLPVSAGFAFEPEFEHEPPAIKAATITAITIFFISKNIKGLLDYIV
jgi:hypothetical protein